DAVLLADLGLGGEAGVRGQQAVDDLLTEITCDTQIRRLLTECHWPLPSGCTDSNSLATQGSLRQARARESLEVMTRAAETLHAGAFSPLRPPPHPRSAAFRPPRGPVTRT